MIGNYIGEANWGHQLALAHANDPEWAYHKVDCWQAVDAGILDLKEIEQARKDLEHRPGEFAALYECKGSAHPLQLIDAESINDVFANDHIGLDHKEEVQGVKYMTADIAGGGVDKTVIYVWAGLRVVEVVVMDTNSRAEAIEAIKALATKYTVSRSRTIVDADGMAWDIDKELKCVGFHGGAAQIKIKNSNFGNLKDQCSYKAAELIKAGVVYSPVYRTEAALEMEAQQRAEDVIDGKTKVRKKKEVKKDIGRSPDHWDNYMMRMYFELSSGSWTDSYINKTK